MLPSVIKYAPAVLDVLAAPPADNPAGTLNTEAILTFIASKIAPILVMAIGLVVLSRAGKGEVSKVLTSTGILIIGVAILAGGGLLIAFGGALVKMALGSGRGHPMARLSTDDDVYRARLLYLGPPGYTLPWQKSYAQYGVFLLLVPVALLIRWLLTWHLPLLPMWEICAAWFTAELIFRFVDADRPARKVVGMLLTDWRAVPEPAADQVAPRLTGRKVVCRSQITGTAESSPRHP